MRENWANNIIPMKTPNFFATNAARVARRRHLALSLTFGLACAVISLAEPAAARSRAFPIPPPGSQPISITEGADGNLWFTLQNSSQVARITPEGVVTEFVTPTFSFPFDITPGPDGNVWFSEGSNGQIAYITPEGEITEIMFSVFDAASGITTGPDNNIWFCDLTGNNIWRYALATQSLTKFPIPTPNSFPQDITAGADGNLWFTELLGGKIGRITTSGVITEFGNLDSPRSITDGPDGNVWFGLSFTPFIGKVTPAGTITLYPTPSRPEQVAHGHGNTILFSEFAANKVATITPDGFVTESQEFRFSEPTGITAGPRRSVWFLGFGNNRVITTVFPR